MGSVLVATGTGCPLAWRIPDICAVEWTCSSGPSGADSGVINIHASACKRIGCATRCGDSHTRSSAKCTSAVDCLGRRCSLPTWTDKTGSAKKESATQELHGRTHARKEGTKAEESRGTSAQTESAAHELHGRAQARKERQRE